AVRSASARVRAASAACPPGSPGAPGDPAGGVPPGAPGASLLEPWPLPGRWPRPGATRLGGRVPAGPGLAGQAGVAVPAPLLAWIPDLPGYRVDAPEVTDHRPCVGVLWRIHQAAPPSPGRRSSSTISASTTSS